MPNHDANLWYEFIYVNKYCIFCSDKAVLSHVNILHGRIIFDLGPNFNAVQNIFE